MKQMLFKLEQSFHWLRYMEQFLELNENFVWAHAMNEIERKGYHREYEQIHLM